MVVQWYNDELAFRKVEAEDRKEWYDEAKLRFDTELAQRLEYAAIAEERWRVVGREQEYQNDRFLIDILWQQMSRVEEETDRLALQKEINRLETQSTKMNAEIVVERNNVQKKESAYWRKKETEDTRRHINERKSHIKELKVAQTTLEAEVTTLTATIDNTTDATIRRKAKVQLKVKQTNLDDLKA
jgi:seryl-tRNA synthetase